MKPTLIDTWGIDSNANDTNDYTTANPEEDPAVDDPFFGRVGRKILERVIAVWILFAVIYTIVRRG